MSPSRRPQARNRRRGGGAAPAKPVDLWHAVPAPPELAAIRPTADPSALLASLGPPPLQTHTTSGQHYFATVAERAAALALALAASAGLLVVDDEG